MKHLNLIKGLMTLRLLVPVAAILCLGAMACHSHGTEPPPVADWEDNSADSARLNINVQTPQGWILYGQYVDLALSQDSLNKSVLVRRVPTNTLGFAIFRKLYPRVYFYKCYAVTNGQSFFGTGKTRLLPAQTKDTILNVH